MDVPSIAVIYVACKATYTLKVMCGPATVGRVTAGEGSTVTYR